MKTRPRHPEAPRTLWAHVADDAPLPPALLTPLATRAHPTLTALRACLGAHLDTSGLQAGYVSLRATFADVPDRAAALRLLDRMHRAMRSDRDIVVRMRADGALSVDAATGPWSLRQGGDGWAWLRVLNDSDRAHAVSLELGGQSRALRVPAGGSRSYLHRVAEGSELEVRAAVDGKTAGCSVALDVRPAWPLTLELTDGPARVYLADALGPLLPPGLAARRDLHGRWYVQLRRRVTVPVVGTVEIDVGRGPEFEPYVATLGRDDVPGARLKLALARRFDPSEQGWLSADLHAHLHYGGEYLLDADMAALAQQAEGLWFLNLVIANQESGVVHDDSYFSPHPVAHATSLTSWGEEFRNDYYGHICLTRPAALVEPVYSGFTGTAQPFDYPTSVNAAQGSRRVGALVSSAHPLINSSSIEDVFEAGRSVEAKELPVLAALRLVDAVDVMSYPGDSLLTARLWYRLLDCGFRLAASAGGDAFMNVADGEAFMHGEPGVIPGSGGRFSSPVGGVRVYAKAARRDRDGLCDAIEAGRTFVTNGPFIALTVAGLDPGSIIDGTVGRQLSVAASVDSWVPLEALELIVNGQMVRRLELRGVPVHEQVGWTLEVTQPAWIALRAVGGPDPGVLDDYAFAHTSAVYVEVDGAGVRDADAMRYFLRWVDRLIAAIPTDLTFAEPWQEQEVRGFYATARQFYAAGAALTNDAAPT